MQPMEDAYRTAVRSVELSGVKIPLASTVTGGVVQPGDATQPLSDPEHWVRQVSSPVLYCAAVEATLRFLVDASLSFLEVGPAPVLLDMSKGWVANLSGSEEYVRWFSSLNREAGMKEVQYVQQVFESISCKTETGLDSSAMVLRKVFPGRTHFRWREDVHPLLQQTISHFDSVSVVHRAIFHRQLMAVYKDCAFQGRAYFPVAGYVEMALAAASRPQTL
jgi:acyl transferase domain-containing protein